MDLRDGWLDEPLKPILRRSRIRRRSEAKLEARIARDAQAIQVSSDVWLELFSNRYPELSGKLYNITNAYPPKISNECPSTTRKVEEGLELIHAGRFLGSSVRRSPDILLTPLLQNLKNHADRGSITLFGPLTHDELATIEKFEVKFRNIGWRMECPGMLPREDLLAKLNAADGLLLLSASFAAIPSKLFEYIPSRKPIFAVTEKHSAVWRICRELPQATLIDMDDPISPSLHKSPFYVCHGSSVPSDYTEESQRTVFLGVIDNIAGAVADRKPVQMKSY
jgi:hypothetical protein